MPLDDIGSYVIVMNDFGLHWQDVNTALGGTAATDLKLEGGFTRVMFLLLRDEIQAALSAMEGLDNARQIAADSRDQFKLAVRDRLSQFRSLLRGLLSKSKYAASAPVLPDLGVGESKFLAPLDDAADLWSRINADTTIAGFTPPLVIGASNLATFTTDIAAVRAAYLAVLTADNDKRLAIRERDVLLPKAREYMVQYRSIVEGLFGTNHPLTQSLPVLNAASGPAASPVVLTGQWNAVDSQAEFAWEASTDPNLDKFQMRMSPGASFNSATATVIGNIPAGSTSFSTTAGLTNSGDVASFKVYVILTSGSEAGSNTITITRP